jgi:hypothetical protein
VTNRLGMNAAIDDVDLGIRRGVVLSSFVDLRSVRSVRRLHRVASSIVRPVSEQFEVAIFGSSVVGQPAPAYGDGPGSKGRARGTGPAASVRASGGSALPSRQVSCARPPTRIVGNLLKVEPQNG